NDRGIHICKSMLAWQKFGNGETPESSGLKGDHLAGKYYVLFDKEYKKQVDELKQQGQTEEEAKKNAPLIKEAQQMLKRWEDGDKEVIGLWKTMNSWVLILISSIMNRILIYWEKISLRKAWQKGYSTGKMIIQFGSIFRPKGSMRNWY